ncbi:alpha/beta hydrolase [Campylobacter lanienae]|uniref:alpha/beta hydrolase n=2 Tax=Campylobacter TaxID=194 RepID=UPI000BB43BF5|nr:alpha/beta hydrolase [Campylobacter lanienae]
MKKFTKLALPFVLSTSLIAANADEKYEQNSPLEPVSLTQKWDKIFTKSNKINHTKVTFKNRYGIVLVGDLYVPKNLNGKAGAIAISGPYGAVKEQSSGIYAQNLAERGFITLAFDPSFTGESGGTPRNISSPEINTEDFSAAVDYLGNLNIVNRDKIGILGICGFGGFALNAAILDTRVKAVATSVMYDMTRVMAKGYNDTNDDKNKRKEIKKAMNEQRFIDAKTGVIALGDKETHLISPENITDKTPKFVAEYSQFYKTKRGFHERSINSNGAWAITNSLPFINMPILSYISELDTPTLIVAGENAHSLYFSQDAFSAINGDKKELVIIPNAVHTDLYDNTTGKIPFDKFEQFFKANL